MRKFIALVWEIVKIVIIAAIIVIPIRYFLFQPFFVRGQSMDPNFENGDYLIIDEITYRFREPQRGEVIVFNSPQNPSQRFIKRIIALPGETAEVKDGRVIIYNEQGIEVLNESEYLPFSLETPGDIKITLGQNEYFVLGDNRVFSLDSRRIGPISKDEIIGRVVLRAWPFVALAKIEAPAY